MTNCKHNFQNTKYNHIWKSYIWGKTHWPLLPRRNSPTMLLWISFHPSQCFLAKFSPPPACTTLRDQHHAEPHWSLRQNGRAVLLCTCFTYFCILSLYWVFWCPLTFCTWAPCLTCLSLTPVQRSQRPLPPYTLFRSNSTPQTFNCPHIFRWFKTLHLPTWPL